MKCQQCAKAAVFHITELEAGSVRELHLCEDHARAYLSQGASASGGAAEGGGPIGPLAVGQTADDLEALDRKACEMCGITFFEFRNQGRLGCPHDYVQFEKELEPLIANIHGATEHVGRKSSGHPGGTDALSAAIGMRRRMHDAVSTEDYERARELRDAIRRIDESVGGTSSGGPSAQGMVNGLPEPASPPASPPPSPP
jgi:protein arginine kinase activator